MGITEGAQPMVTYSRTSKLCITSNHIPLSWAKDDKANERGCYEVQPDVESEGEFNKVETVTESLPVENQVGRGVLRRVHKKHRMLYGSCPILR